MSYPLKDEIEKEQIDWVFGLTGGELCETPIRVASLAPNYGPTSMAVHRPRYDRKWYRYWYDGSPEYHEEPRGESATYITIVTCLLYSGTMPKKIYAKGRAWRKVATYTHSGETECPGRANDHGGIVQPSESRDKVCRLCEANTYEPHEFIYLGDGWAEVVYRSRDA